MSFAASLPYVQQILTLYGMSTYVILGSVGSIFNIAMFSQSTYRKNPCGLYILSMSICGICGLNISAVPVIWGVTYPSPFLYNQWSCGLFFYFRHSLNQMLRTFFVAVCADRYAGCHNNARIRSFSQYKVALRVIPAVLIFWFLLPIFPTGIRTLSNGVCDARSGTYDIVYTVYIISTTGFFPLTTMTIFGILMIRNLRQMRSRIQPSISHESGGNMLRKRDRDMMRMLLIEIIICNIVISPNTITHIYKSATVNVVKTKERQQIESFFYFLLVYSYSIWLILFHFGFIYQHPKHIVKN